MMKLIIKLFIKKIVVSEKPYKKNMRTAPEFLISDKRVFDAEKQNLISIIKETQKKGSAFFEGKENPAFGKLTAEEWNFLFYKHLDHHLNQFGV